MCVCVSAYATCQHNYNNEKHSCPVVGVRSRESKVHIIVMIALIALQLFPPR